MKRRLLAGLTAVTCLAACATSDPAADMIAGAPHDPEARNGYDQTYYINAGQRKGTPQLRGRPDGTFGYVTYEAFYYLIVTVEAAAPSSSVYTQAGTGEDYPFAVSIHPRPTLGTGRLAELPNPAPDLIRRVATGEASADDVLETARIIASQTFCEGGETVINEDIRRRMVFDETVDREEVRRFLMRESHVRRILVDGLDAPIPQGASIVTVPPVEYRSNKWQLRLRCSLWREQEAGSHLAMVSPD